MLPSLALPAREEASDVRWLVWPKALEQKRLAQAEERRTAPALIPEEPIRIIHDPDEETRNYLLNLSRD